VPVIWQVAKAKVFVLEKETKAIRWARVPRAAWLWAATKSRAKSTAERYLIGAQGKVNEI
jgi:hypothetical protein